jgi:hypothetical protein
MSLAEREEKKAKLALGFIPEEFTSIVNSAIGEFSRGDDNLAFIPNIRSWEVLTSVVIKYNHGGWYQYDAQEKITHVSLRGVVRINGNPRGTEEEVRWSPDKGCYNLKEIVHRAYISTPVEPDKPEPGSVDFSLDRIMSTSYEVEGDDTTDDWRIEEVADALMAHSVPKRQAFKTAHKVVAANPNVQDVDALLDHAMQAV